MTTLFIQDNFECYFFLICSAFMTVILFSAWDKSCDLGAKWSKLEQM